MDARMAAAKDGSKNPAKFENYEVAYHDKLRLKMENKEQLDDVEEAKALLDAHLDDTLEHELSAADLTEHLKTLKKHDEEKYVEFLKKARS